MISPTRKKLDERRGRYMLLLGITQIISAALWRRVCDLDFAEGKKAAGALSAVLSLALFALGIANVRGEK